MRPTTLVNFLNYVRDKGLDFDRHDAAATLGCAPGSVAQARCNLIASGHVRNLGSNINPQMVLTKLGEAVLEGTAPPPIWNRDKKPEHSPVRRTKRLCLMCREFFKSEGPHEQICQSCKSTKAWQSAQGTDYSISGYQGLRGQRKPW